MKLRNSEGISAGPKMFWLMLIAAAVGVSLYLLPGFETTLAFPFFKGLNPDLGL